jgi:DNA-binding NarL/FixJ family response regulator
MNATGALRVVIADGDAPTRKALRDALEEAHIEVCGEARDAATAVRTVERAHPDVVLLDVDVPGDGIQAAADISDVMPDASVVLLTASEDTEQLFRGLAAGAVGYLAKDMDPQRLPDVLQGVQRGESALPRALVSRVVEELNVRGRQLDLLVGRSSDDRLTSREWEVLELLRKGYTTAQIADELFVSRATVRTHVSGILRKLKVPDREAAVRLMAEGGTPGPAATA